MGDNADEDAEITEVPEAVEMEETLTTSMINMIQAAVKDNGTFNIISTTIPILKPKSLSSTTYGTAIQVPNPI